MNRRTSVVMAAVIILVVAVALVIGLRGSHSAADGCRPTGTPVVHKAVIHDGKVSGGHLTAKLCDTLQITNEDGISREVAFGLHEHHEPYDGVTERVLGKGDSFVVTLNQAGSFRWHDHLHDEVQGFFTVTR